MSVFTFAKGWWPARRLAPAEKGRLGFFFFCCCFCGELELALLGPRPPTRGDALVGRCLCGLAGERRESGKETASLAEAGRPSLPACACRLFFQRENLPRNSAWDWRREVAMGLLLSQQSPPIVFACV